MAGVDGAVWRTPARSYGTSRLQRKIGKISRRCLERKGRRREGARGLVLGRVAGMRRIRWRDGGAPARDSSGLGALERGETRGIGGGRRGEYIGG